MSRFKQLNPKFKAPSKQVVRKNLNLDAMMATAHNKFIDFPDTRPRKCKISQADALMSGYAMFALKDPSLLAFDQRRNNDEGNLKRVFGLQNVPSDSQMREILDPVDPELFRPLFREIFSQLQRGKALEPLAYYQGCYLLSSDGAAPQTTEGCNVCHQQNAAEDWVFTQFYPVLRAAKPGK